MKIVVSFILLGDVAPQETMILDPSPPIFPIFQHGAFHNSLPAPKFADRPDNISTENFDRSFHDDDTQCSLFQYLRPFQHNDTAVENKC